MRHFFSLRFLPVCPNAHPRLARLNAESPAMHDREFDALTRALTKSRRALIYGGLLALTQLVGLSHSEAKKSKNGKKKKDRCTGAKSFNGCCSNGKKKPGTTALFCGRGGAQ